MTQLRIGVAADIHSDERANNWTRVSSEPPIARPLQQPLADLVDFIGASNIRTDYLLAVGDLANQSNSVGLTYGWRKVHLLASALGADLLGVPGNHDIVTHAASTDPRHALKSLIPSFPTGDASGDSHFWAHGWVLLERPSHRILLIDSTLDFPAFPGTVSHSSRAWKDYQRLVNRGGFPERIQTEIATALVGLSEKLNVAVLHHHPLEHQNHSWLQDEYGPMRRGGELVELLSASATTGRWLIVHGHKHIPQLVSATSSTTNGPVILCGASVGAKLWDPIQTVTRNQFHVVTIDDSVGATSGGLAGTVESYTWGFGIGWRLSERIGSGLPAAAGFGSQEHFRTLATRVEDELARAGADFVPYSALLTAVPELPYVLPADWDLLENYLDSRAIDFSRNRNHEIVQVSRRS